jgi:hypothetical protein
VLTRLDAIDGVENSFALLADDGNRMVQITIRPGAKVTKVVEEVRRALRAEVQERTPVQLENKPVDALGPKQNWLTIGQLQALATEESSPQRFDMRYSLLALTMFFALCAFLYWLLRRRSARQRSAIRLNAPHLPIVAS